MLRISKEEEEEEEGIEEEIEKEDVEEEERIKEERRRNEKRKKMKEETFGSNLFILKIEYTNKNWDMENVIIELLRSAILGKYLILDSCDVIDVK
ncbi:hypothetical protein HZH68_011926 [Vespula germanica]|uniref:Uncharacterized protein n=1 Tax=Vespula germanica TaxID=30212 RepID=A0A834JKV6_VESGE|nr:hypothetical protein HZH68_011926 [Vespula germanica]